MTIQKDSEMNETPTTCLQALFPVRDVLDLLNGKWTIPVIVSLSMGDQRFTELQKDLAGISPRVLSKELKMLELNKLVECKFVNPATEIITYSLTPYGFSLRELIAMLYQWGMAHRQKVFWG